MKVTNYFTWVRGRVDVRWARFLLAAVVVALFLGTLPAARASEPIEYGYRDFPYPSGTGGNSEPTGEKPESKLWWNDGTWWGSLWSTAGNAYHIYRLDLTTQSWIDTGTAIDDRLASRADTLWDGQHLYVVSHIFAKNAGAPAPAGQRGELYRYNYDVATKTYSLDSGFPVEVTGGESETLVVEKDANGKLWVTYVEDQKVMVNRSLNGDDRQWGTPFQIPGSESNVSDDDISSIITYNQHVGVMWSNQNSPKEMYFAVHPVGAGDTTWTPVRAYGVSGDDHISLKSLEADSAGNVYAAIKTSRNEELIVLLVCENNVNRCKQESDWSSYPVYDGTHSPTRPILLIDTSNRDLYVFTRNKDASGASGIYYKTASLDAIQFPMTSIGTPFIKNSVDTGLNDPTSTKQNLTSATGMVVLASDGDDYFHNYKSLPSGATQYSLTVNTEGSGTVTLDPPGGLYDENSQVTLTATAAPGWTFTGWSGDYAGTDNPATITMDANKTITANFTGADPTQYTLTVDVAGTGSVSLDPTGGLYDPDTVVTMTATAGSGWAFSGWSGDYVGTDNPATITMDADKSVTANFSESGQAGEVIYRETQAGSSVESSSVGTTLPLTAAAGDLYLAAISTKTNVAVNSVSGLGLSWTEVRAQCAGRDQTGIAVWMASGTPSGDDTVTASFQTAPSNAVIAVTRYSGVDSGAPIGAIVSGNTNGADGACSSGTDSDVYSFDLTTTGDGSVVYGAVAIRNKTHQAGTGFLERIEIAEGSGGQVAAVAVQDKTVASASTTTVDGTISSTTDWAVVGVEVKPEILSGPAQYTVITTTVGSGSITLDPPGGTYDEGAAVELTATAEPGWVFTGWSGDLSGTANPATLNMDGNKSVAATFVEQHTLTVNTDGTGSGTVALDPPGGVYEAGTVVTMTAAADSGSTFSGWSGHATGTANPTTVTMDADKIVTATFTADSPTQYTVMTTTVGSGSITLNPAGGVYEEGTTVTMTAVAETGWIFDGWSGALSGSVNPETLVMDGDKSVTATFVEEPAAQYTLTVNTDGTGSGTVALDPPGGIYDAGTVVTMTAAADIGSTFSGWSGDATGTANPTTLAMDADKIVTATFTADSPTQYTVATSTVGSGSITLNPAGGVYDEGELVEVTAVADSGWVFSGWSGALSGTANPQTLAMDGDKSVTATFVEEPAAQYTLTVNTDGTGSGTVALDPSGGIYDVGTVVTMTATADSGSTFSGWSGDATGTANPTTVTIDADKIVTATFTADSPTQYTVMTTTVGSGSITLNPAGGVYEEGTLVEVTAVADSGWVFDGWSGDLSGTTNPATLTIDADKSVTATFVEEPAAQYTVVTTTVGSGSITLSPAGGVYEEGTLVEVTAVADFGWVFDGWSGDLSGTTNPATLTIDADKSVTATFLEQSGGGEVKHEQTVTGSSVGSASVSTDGPIVGVAGELYLAAISTKTNVGVQSVEGLGLSWTEVRAQCAGRDQTGVAVWMALGTPSGDGIVSATLTDSPNNAVIAVSRYSGVDASDPLGNVVSGNTNGTDGACSGGSDSDSYAFDLTTSVNGSIVYGAVAIRNKNHEPGAGYTELVEIAEGNGGSMAAVAVQEKAVASASSVLVEGTISSKTDWAVIGLEIRPGASGGTNQHVLTTDTSGSGSVALNPSGGVYDAGTEVTLTATAASGWSFSGWSGDLTGSANPATVTMDGDKAITANFTASDPSQHALTVNTVGSGNVTLDPAGGVYDEGTTVTLTAVADSGWTFSGWSGDLTGTANPQTLLMDGDKSVTATFTADSPTQYTLTANSIGSGNVILEPAGGTYPAGTEVTLTAIANSGWVFSGWSGDLSGTTNPETLLMDSDKSVTATFLEQTSGGEIRHEQTVTGSSVGSASVSTDGPIVGAAGELYLAAISTKTNVGVQSVDGLGLDWSQVRAQCAGRDQTGVAVWMALGTPSGDGIVSATLTDSPNNAVIAVSRYSGVDISDPLGNVVSGNTNGTDGACSGGSDSDSYAFDLTTSVNGSIVYGAVAIRNKNHAPGAGYTELVEVAEGSGGSMAAVAVQEKAVASASSVLVEGTISSSTDWAVIGLEIRPSAGTLQNVLSINAADRDVAETESNERIRDGDAVAPRVALKPDWSLSG